MTAMVYQLDSVLIPPVRVSSLMETDPVDVEPGQSAYYNRILCGGFTGSPEELLDRCNEIEIFLGRSGKGLKTSRTADIDILLFGDIYIDSERLVIPHPQIFSRRFCLEGLCEIAPDWIIPGRNLTVRDVHATMKQSVRMQGVRKIDE
jgi:2-amino-4-hydroxy-6-hydroxymethyldihydropteridine diphosphokinase